MSGLAGWIDGSGALAHRAAAETMIATLRHRGPCGSQAWEFPCAALGLARNAAAGCRERVREPVVPDIRVVLDGYVANLDELREAVGIDGEPEALIALAYRRWGCSFPEKLAGAFAIALWDERERLGLLVRDPIGVKPLYYAPWGDGVLFASEPKAIFAVDGFPVRLGPSSLSILLQPRLARAGETPLRDLFEVRPGTMLACRPGSLREIRYWALRSAPHEESYPATVEHVRALLEESVRGATRGQDRCAAMLSGGLDSTAVAALAPVRKVETFCIRLGEAEGGFSASELRPDVDAPFAAAAASHLGTRHREVALTTPELLDAIPAARRARDLPGWGQFDASMHCLFSRMASAAPAGLSGEAADELFGGYPYFFDAQTVSRGQFPWRGDGLRLIDYVAPSARDGAVARDDEAERYRDLMAQVPRLAGEAAHEARMRELLYLGMAGPLAVVLDRKDRMSSAFGLDLRLPYCDHRLVEYVWNVPWRMKCHGETKGLLKDAVRDVLPQTTLTRRKSAYPHTQDAGYHAALVAELRDIADDANSPVHAFFDAAGLRRLIRDLTATSAAGRYPGGAEPAYMLVHVVELHHWLRDYRVSLS